jgi:hypothetical protein
MPCAGSHLYQLLPSVLEVISAVCSCSVLHRCRTAQRSTCRTASVRELPSRQVALGQVSRRHGSPAPQFPLWAWRRPAVCSSLCRTLHSLPLGLPAWERNGCVVPTFGALALLFPAVPRRTHLAMPRGHLPLPIHKSATQEAALGQRCVSASGCSFTRRTDVSASSRTRPSGPHPRGERPRRIPMAGWGWCCGFRSASSGRSPGVTRSATQSPARSPVCAP